MDEKIEWVKKIENEEQYATALVAAQNLMSAEPLSPSAYLLEEYADACEEFEKEFFKAG